MSTLPTDFNSPAAIHAAHVHTMMLDVIARNNVLQTNWNNYFYTTFLPNLSAHPEQTHDPSPPPLSWVYHEDTDTTMQDGPPVATIPPFTRPAIVPSAPVLGPNSPNAGPAPASNPLAGLDLNTLMSLLLAILQRGK